MFNVMTVIMEFKSKTSEKEDEDRKQSAASNIPKKEDVAKMLSNSQKDALKKGIADCDVLRKCWTNFTSQGDNAAISFKQLCLIFQAYCLIYPIEKNPDGNKYLIPCMLQEETKDLEKLPDKKHWFSMFFDFHGFLPAQIYHRLVCLLLGDKSQTGSSTLSPNWEIFTSTVCVLSDVKDCHWKVKYKRNSHRLKISVL